MTLATATGLLVSTLQATSASAQSSPDASRVALDLALHPVSGTAAPTGTIVMLTEEYPPYGFTRGGEIVGSSVDQVRRIMAEVHPDYTLDVMPWARAIATAETSPDTCVFTTTWLPERNDRFKWVLPLNEDMLALVGRTGGRAAPVSIEAAKTSTVAVYRGDSGEIFAKANGFKHLDSAPSLELSLKKLLAGRVDFMLLTTSTVDDLRERGEPLEAIFNVETTRSGIACNPSVPDETIAAMQASLDRLIADGFQAEAVRRFHVTPK
jgi:polar amino acid transport system substrate-binding protein